MAACKNSSASSWKSIDVTSQVAADLAAGRTRTQFRVRGLLDNPDGDGVSDLINLTDGSYGADFAPQLRIVYELP